MEFYDSFFVRTLKDLLSSSFITKHVPASVFMVCNNYRFNASLNFVIDVKDILKIIRIYKIICIFCISQNVNFEMHTIFLSIMQS